MQFLHSRICAYMICLKLSSVDFILFENVLLSKAVLDPFRHANATENLLYDDCVNVRYTQEFIFLLWKLYKSELTVMGGWVVQVYEIVLVQVYAISLCTFIQYDMPRYYDTLVF